MSAVEPTPEQEQRAKWDLLLAEIELRQQQIRSERPKWDLMLADLELRQQQIRSEQPKLDLLLADLELRQEQIRSERQDVRLAVWPILIQSVLVAAALLATGVAIGRFALFHT